MRRASLAAGMDEGPSFLAGGGEMGALIRAHDWAATPLGPPEGWPQGLRTAVRIALTTRHPIFIFWGAEHVCLYNDGYRPSLGPEKHPAILGACGREAWAEIWPIIGPQVEQVMRGEGATWHENQLVPIVRHGGLQEVYWTYSYGPIDDETAPTGVGGVLVVCTETTQQVLAGRRAVAERERLEAMFQQAPGFICTMRGPDHVFEFANDEHRRLFGERGVLGKPVREAFPDIAGQGFYELLDRVYATGERVVMHSAAARLRPTPEAAEQELFLDFIYAPMRDETGTVTGVYCSGYDVTDRKRAETALRDADARLRAMADAAPVLIWENDETGMIFCNGHYLDFFGVGFDALRAMCWAGLLHPDDAPAYIAAYREAFARREPFVREFRCRRADGQYRGLRTSSRPVGESRFVGGSFDVTELQEAQFALHEAQRLAHVGSWTWSAATDATTGSPEFYRIYGLNPDRHRFPDFREQRGVLYPVESWETIDAAARRTVESGVGYELDVEALRGSEPIWITTRCDVARDAEGRVVGLRGTVQDITGRKRAELADAEQSRLLELVAAGRPLNECLTAVMAALARLAPRARASVLLADAEGAAFSSVHTPGFPPSFGLGLEGAPVTSPDIAKDERWPRPWRELCVAHGVLACHSEPVLGPDDRCFGSLMLAFGEARQPSAWELRTAAFGARIAGIAIARDRGNQELRASEERYRTLFEAIDAGFCIVELEFDAAERPIDYRFVEVNPAFARQAGLSDAVGRTAREIVPELEPHWFEIYGRVARTGEPARFENGSAAMGRWFDVYAFRIGEPGARRVAILFNDVTARREAELELRELNETLERRVAAAIAERKVLADIVEGTDAFVQVADLDFRWLAINKASADEFERIYGVRPKVGDSMLDLLADRPEHQASVRAV